LYVSIIEKYLIEFVDVKGTVFFNLIIARV